MDLLWPTVPGYSVPQQKLVTAIHITEQRSERLCVSYSDSFIHPVQQPNAGNGAAHSGLGLSSSIIMGKTIPHRHASML